MKKIDADTIFSIFETVYESDDDSFDPFTHPYVLMGLVISGVATFKIIARNYQEQYPEQFSKIYENVKSLYYDRLYGFIEKIDPCLSIHLLECCKHDRVKIVSSLSAIVKLYEKREEYRKCARIKTLMDAIVAF